MAVIFPTPLRCADCGLPYVDFPLDLLLPRSQWVLIFPESEDGSGLLCARCIVARAEKVPGATAVHAVIEIAPVKKTAEDLPEPVTRRADALGLRHDRCHEHGRLLGATPIAGAQKPAPVLPDGVLERLYQEAQRGQTGVYTVFREVLTPVIEQAQRTACAAVMQQWQTWGVIEIAARNVNVKSYADHWETRALKAEQALAAARERCDNALTRRLSGDTRDFVCGLPKGHEGSCKWEAVTNKDGDGPLAPGDF